MRLYYSNAGCFTLILVGFFLIVFLKLFIFLLPVILLGVIVFSFINLFKRSRRNNSHNINDDYSYSNNNGDSNEDENLKENAIDVEYETIDDEE
jgi:hypothetical protein